MHSSQIDFCLSIKRKFPKCFQGFALDVGSLDINGSNRSMFIKGNYIGLDIGKGANVDIICHVHEYNPGFLFDCIISTEMLEHDKYYKKSLKAMFELLEVGGLLLLTAAANDRKEHGTYRANRESSPFTLDYYKNVTKRMIIESLDMKKFKEYNLQIIKNDLHFWGIKK